MDEPDEPTPHHNHTLLGEWPSNAPRVTLDLEHVKIREAIKKLAAAAHWGVTFKDSPHGRVDATFNDVPADEALSAILKDHGLTAERHGELVTIAEAHEEESDDEDKTTGSEDTSGERTQIGSSVKVAEGETVRSAVSVGSDVDVDGTVLHDAVSVGGNVRLGPKAVVNGDVVSVGGSLDIDPNAKVKGSRVSMGIGGLGRANRYLEHHSDEGSHEGHGIKGWIFSFFESLARFALFFVLGLLLLAFAPERVKSVGRELRRTPVLCTGVGLVGMVALVPLTLLLIITIIGILVVPFLYLAVAAALLLGFTALALEIGSRVPPKAAKRTQVLVLALGVAVLFVVDQLPFVGFLVLMLACFVTFGAALRTRLGGNRLDANFVPEP
jgi:hypothetical protein